MDSEATKGFGLALGARERKPGGQPSSYPSSPCRWRPPAWRDGRRGHDPPRGRRLVLRVGRAARRPIAARPPRDRGRRGRPGRQLRSQGLRRADAHGREAGSPPLPPGHRRASADGGVLGGEQGDVRRLPGHDAARRRALDRRGVPRRRRAAADRGHSVGDRRPTAGDRARAGRHPHHRGHRADEVPGEGGERRGQARRFARRPDR